MSYAEFMTSQVVPYLDSRRVTCGVTTRDGKNLHCEKYAADDPRGTVFIVHGFTENAVKYSEAIYRFLTASFSVLIYEQRGHGRSWRALDDVTLTHVDRFESYTEDLEDVVSSAKDMPKPFFLFAHSMGGAVGAQYLETGSTVFSKAILTSPMIAPARGGVPLFAAKAICRAAFALGKKEKRIFNSQPYPGKESFADACSTDEEKFTYYEAIKRKNELFHNYSPTYGWLFESLVITSKLLAKGKPENIAVPVLVISAQLDTVVLTDEQKKFADRLKNGSFAVIEGAKHEIYLSTPDVADPYFERVISFFRG